jgi:hypothetical protein
MPVDLQILGGLPTLEDIRAIKAGAWNDGVVRLSVGYFHILLDIVKYDPVNEDLFADRT